MPATLLEARGIRATAFRPPRQLRGARATVSGPGLSRGARATAFRPPGYRAAQGRRPSVSRKRPAQGWRTCLQPSWKRVAREWRPSGPGQSRGVRAAAFRPPEAPRARLAGMPTPLLEARGIRVTVFRPPGNCAARGRLPSGPRAIVWREGEGLSAPGKSRCTRAAAFRPPGNRAAQGRLPFGPQAIARQEGGGLSAPGSASRKAGGHARNPPGSARREGVLPTRARLPAGNAAFLGPPPGWGSRGTGAENPPGRGMGLGGFGKREGDQRESLVETSGRCSRSSRSVRPRPGVSSRWMWPSRMPMSPSMISGKVR